MKQTPAASVSATAQYTVDRERAIDFMGEAARADATPVPDLEIACRNRLLEHRLAAKAKHAGLA